MDEGIALVAAVGLLGLPVAGWIVVRGMEHTERMEMIRRGMMPPPYAVRIHLARAPQIAGVYAMIVLSVMLLAVALLVGFAAIAFPAEVSGQIPSWVGGALVGSTLIAFAIVMRARAIRGQKRIKDAGASLMIIQKK